jgi:hypothetical protein
MDAPPAGEKLEMGQFPSNSLDDRDTGRERLAVETEMMRVNSRLVRRKVLNRLLRQRLNDEVVVERAQANRASPAKERRLVQGKCR